MYKKSVQGWLKHLDFMILDVVCLWISFTLAFNMRHGSLDVLANSLYRDMMWSLALMDIVVIFFFDSLKNVLKTWILSGICYDGQTDLSHHLMFRILFIYI